MDRPQSADVTGHEGAITTVATGQRSVDLTSASKALMGRLLTVAGILLAGNELGCSNPLNNDKAHDAGTVDASEPKTLKCFKGTRLTDAGDGCISDTPEDSGIDTGIDTGVPASTDAGCHCPVVPEAGTPDCTQAPDAGITADAGITHDAGITVVKKLKLKPKPTPTSTTTTAVTPPPLPTAPTPPEPTVARLSIVQIGNAVRDQQGPPPAPTASGK